MNYRDPHFVSYFNPYCEGDIVKINNQDWTIKNEVNGWYLTNTGNWKGTHPEIKGIKSMIDLIGLIVQFKTKSESPF